MKWICNSKMNNLVASLTDDTSEVLCSDVCKLQALYVPSFKKVNDCVLISKKNVAMLAESFDKALTMYGDKTGYEASNTETCINDFFDNTLSLQSGTKIALSVIKLWALQLKELDPSSRFCIILCCEEERIEVRVHKVRDNELPWFTGDIESDVDCAIGFAFV
ncbi:MAG: hypothetical protein K2P18_06170 [Oscillospiraceae bacterium]|nr:hypothetical protein [Oscillospiraceae bacterium]